MYKNKNVSPDWGKDPLQFAVELFRLRDKLAHGKTERIYGPRHDSEDGAVNYVVSNYLVPKWFHGINKEWITEARNRNDALLLHLSELYGIHENQRLMTATCGTSVFDEKEIEKCEKGFVHDLG